LSTAQFIKGDIMSVLAPIALIIGDTPRWLNSVKASLPIGIEKTICTDCGSVNQILYFEDRKFDLLITVLSLGEKDDGLKILREFRRHDKDTPVVFFSRIGDGSVRKEIADLGGIIIRPQHLNGASPELLAKITELLGVAA